MCGRFTIASPQQLIEQRFKAQIKFGDFRQRYNAAPGQKLPIITNQKPDEIIQARWGFLPSWLKEKKPEGFINARAESIAEKPSFKNAFLNRRCLVIADGFFEWQRKLSGKIPYYITLNDHDIFAFAGLFEESESEISFAILTCEPNSLVEKIHNRMPVILKPDAEHLWLQDSTDPTSLRKILIPYPAKEMQAFPVSSVVNSPENDSESLIQTVSLL